MFRHDVKAIIAFQALAKTKSCSGVETYLVLGAASDFTIEALLWTVI
jgi:hypothetical protein